MKNPLIFALLLALPLTGLAEDTLQACRKAVDAGDYAASAKTAATQNTFDGVMCAGRAQQAVGEDLAAIETFAKAEKLAENAFNRTIAATFLARATRAAGKPDVALEHYARSLKLAQASKMEQAQWANLNEIGQIYQEKGDAKMAVQRYTEAYPFAANDNERSESNQLLASAYSLSGNHDRAIEHQLKSVMLEERSGDANHYLDARLQLAAYAVAAKDYPRANKEIADVIKVSKDAGSVYWEARASLQLARLEKSRGNLELARSTLKIAAELAGKSGVEALQRQIAQEGL